MDPGMQVAPGEDAVRSKRKLLSPGKVPWEVVSGYLSSGLPPEVLLGPAQGEDAALVDINGEVWAIASDPITFTSKDAGRLSVVVNANDVAVRGAAPLYYTATVLLSPGESQVDTLSALLGQIRVTCASMGIALIGGHTEVTPGLHHTVIAGTMMGKVVHRPVTTGGLGDSDWIGMTKWAALEGTSILVNEFEQKIKDIFGRGALESLKKILASDWLSVVPEALEAAAMPEVTSMHDVTEGGVGEALHEMAAASGRSIEVFTERIPLLPGTEKICSHAGIHPLGLIGSGSLLVGCREEGKRKLEGTLAQKGIPFAWIGRAGKRTDTPSASIPRFERDEILKAFSFFEKGCSG
jgi:hydrogenase maturation factor